MEGLDDFDLRDEVMSCIAKSIGLLQPPLSGEASGPTSPAFPPSEGGRSRTTSFPTSFGSLSLLDMGDDSSSVAGGSSSVAGTDGMSGLDNEVEILFFSAGSTLARAEERNTGLQQHPILSLTSLLILSFRAFLCYRWVPGHLPSYLPRL
jgi:lysophospholipid hydrolase